MKIENVIRDGEPMPSHTMNRGARAIFGISWKKITFG